MGLSINQMRNLYFKKLVCKAIAGGRICPPMLQSLIPNLALFTDNLNHSVLFKLDTALDSC